MKTTQEERDSLRAEFGNPMTHLGWQILHALDDADRLAAIERQVIYRTADMPTWADGWQRARDGYCRYYSIGFKPPDPDPVVICEEAPDLRPDEPGPLWLPIIDPPDEEDST